MEKAQVVDISFCSVMICKKIPVFHRCQMLGHITSDHSEPQNRWVSGDHFVTLRCELRRVKMFPIFPSRICSFSSSEVDLFDPVGMIFVQQIGVSWCRDHDKIGSILTSFFWCLFPGLWNIVKLGTRCKRCSLWTFDENCYSSLLNMVIYTWFTH